MNLLIRTETGSIVYSELRRDAVFEKLRKTQVILTDLDDTDAISPAKEIAKKHFQRGESLSFEYISWGVRSSWKRVRKGKSFETEIWKEYIERFLHTKEQRVWAVELFTPQNIQHLLYPSVKEFYQALPQSHNVYVTRNIVEVARVFARTLKINEVISESWDKPKTIEQFIHANPWFKRYLIKGDSEEDEEMLKVAQYYKQKGIIEDVNSIWVTPTPEKQNERFTLTIGRSYEGLVELLKK